VWQFLLLRKKLDNVFVIYIKNNEIKHLFYIVDRSVTLLVDKQPCLSVKLIKRLLWMLSNLMILLNHAKVI